MDALCGNAVLRGADIYSVGIVGCTASGNQYQLYRFLTFAVDVGDIVSVYVDMDKECLKGQTARYNGRKQFIGNGVSSIVR